MSRTVDAALMALEVELLNWTGYVLEEIGRGCTWSGSEPAETINLDWWYVVAKEQQGPKHRGYFQGHGATLVIAIDGLTTELVSRRTEPHQWHVSDWMAESCFVVGCADCERDAADLFDGQVEWVPG